MSQQTIFGVFFNYLKMWKPLLTCRRFWESGLGLQLAHRVWVADSCPCFTYADTQAKPKKTNLCVCVIKNNHWNYPYYMERRLQGKVVRDFEMTKGKILEVTYEMLRVAWSPVGHDL